MLACRCRDMPAPSGLFRLRGNAAPRSALKDGCAGDFGAAMEDPQKLRELAAWYREFAEKTGNPSIWESRLRMAEDLEQEADLLERRQQPVAAK